MADEKGATEDQLEKITVIRGDDALGYEGRGREEHSGEEQVPGKTGDLEADLANNEAKDL